MIALGLMSGTSCDGVDAALVEIRPRGDGYAVDLKRFATAAYGDALSAALRAALPPNAGSLAEVARLHRALGEAFASAAATVLRGETPDYVASHGHTIFHDGEASVTLQVGDAFLIRERVGATVCYDFRSADCAAGGQGAPLVPYVDTLLFASADEDRVALNIGGIANATFLRKGEREPVAFDTGPGNLLLDALVFERTGGRERFDRDGALGQRGRVDAASLDEMLAEPYFAASPPKSTGRERFGAQFLDAHPRLAALPLEDAAATLAELTAATVAAAVTSAGLSEARVIVSGGGAKNAALMARLGARLPRARVERSDLMGVPADAKEAIAFAVLGYETLRGRAANLPSATGARERVVLGAIAPHNLRSLLERIALECA